VGWLSSMAHSPLTMTWLMPRACCLGLSNVAVSVTVAGSKQHQIGGVTLADEAAVGEPKPLCGTAGQMVDAFLETQQADLADVVS